MNVKTKGLIIAILLILLTIILGLLFGYLLSEMLPHLFEKPEILRSLVIS